MVVDARGTMRGIAPLLIGYQVFDEESTSPASSPT